MLVTKHAKITNDLVKIYKLVLNQQTQYSYKAHNIT